MKGTQHRGEEYREEDNLGEHTIPLVHHPSYRACFRSVRGGFPCHTASLTSRPYLSTLPILLRHPASGRRGTRGDDGRMESEELERRDKESDEIDRGSLRF